MRPQTVEPISPDILIVLDTSASMNDAFDGASCAGGCGADSKWAQSVAAIDALPNGSSPMIANWGLELISTASDACDAGGVVVAPGPATGPAIRDALASRSSTPSGLLSPGNRPARAAIDTATANRLGATDSNTQIMVLVTDGVPNCRAGEPDPLASDADGANQAIMNAATVGIAICVVGIGTAGGPADATLSQMAAAGMSSCPISPAYVSINAGAGLVATLSSIATQSGACRYPVPYPPNDYTSRQWLNVYVDGAQIPQDPANGWTFANNAMSAFFLNGAACEASQGHTVSVTFRCPLP